MIKLGGEIGAFNTVALIFLTAIIGLYFARIQGIQTLKAGIRSLYENKNPFYEIISGASIAIAALLLIVPGFLTDFIGFLLLIPLTRKIFLKLTIKDNSQRNFKKGNNTLEGEIVDNKKKDET